MANIFIIHGAYGNPDENWIPWLKTELEKLGNRVFVPKFPSGYFFHLGRIHDPAVGSTYDFVSKDEIDSETNKKGSLVVKDGAGEWQVWCAEYGYENVDYEINLLNVAVESIVSGDFNNFPDPFAEVVYHIKNYHNQK